MNIIVVGGGKLGSTITEYLSAEGHDVVVIDTNANVVEELVNTFDVIGVVGNGASYPVLTEAGADKAYLIITATPSDELNILCCMLAKRMGTRHAIARVRDPEYSQQLDFMRSEFGLSMMVNPEYEAANEISRMLRFPSAMKIESFSKGRAELAEIMIGKENPLAGMPLHSLAQHFKAKVLICAVERDEQLFIPTGNFVLQEGDKIHIISSRSEISSFLKQLGIYKQRVKSVIIIGGGKIAYYLAKHLSDIGMSIKIVEIDEKRCEELSEEIPKATIICGDGSDQNLLTEIGIDSTDACVALTGIDEENIILSIYAVYRCVDKVITKINRSSFVKIFNAINGESVVSPKEITANRIIRYVRAKQNSTGSNVQTLYKIVNNQAEAVEFIATEDLSFLGKPIKTLNFKKDLLIACITRGSKVIIPRGDDHIEAGDSVIIVTSNQYLDDLENILQ